MMDRDYLKEAAEAMKAKLPDGFGFILLAAPFGPGDGKQRLVYISNMKRECAINVLKEWLIKASADEDWMQHLK